ncbi:hypothetical protein ACOMHN_008871 [Nucella lapillus]
MEFQLTHKNGGEVFLEKLTTLFQSIWGKGEVPRDFKDAPIVHIYKRVTTRPVTIIVGFPSWASQGRFLPGSHSRLHHP